MRSSHADDIPTFQIYAVYVDYIAMERERGRSLLGVLDYTNRSHSAM